MRRRSWWELGSSAERGHALRAGSMAAFKARGAHAQAGDPWALAEEIATSQSPTEPTAQP